MFHRNPIDPYSAAGDVRTSAAVLWIVAAFLGASAVMANYVWALAIFGTLLVASIVFLRPVFGVVLIVSSVYLLNIGFKQNNTVRTIDEFTPIVTVFIVFVVAIFTLRKGGSIRRGAYDRFLGYEDFPLYLFFGFALVSLLWTIDFEHGIRNLIMMILIFWLIKEVPKMINTPGQITGLLKYYPFLAIPLMGLLLMSKEYHDYKYSLWLFDDVKFTFFFHTIGSSNHLRLGGYAPVNIAANIINTFIFINCFLFRRGNLVVRMLLTAHTLILFYCLIKTGSKAGLVSLMMGIVVLCLIIPELRERFIKLMGAGLLALSLVLAVAGKMLIKRFEVMVSGQDNFVTDRLGWWSKGLDYLVDSFGVGTGAGGFPKLIDPVPAAHSFYFGTVFEYGIVGIMLFLLIIGLIVWKLVKAMPLIEGDEMRMAFYCLFVALLVTLVHGLLDFEYAYLPFWIMVALLFSIIKVSVKEKAGA